MVIKISLKDAAMEREMEKRYWECFYHLGKGSLFLYKVDGMNQTITKFPKSSFPPKQTI